MGEDAAPAIRHGAIPPTAYDDLRASDQEMRNWKQSRTTWWRG